MTRVPQGNLDVLDTYADLSRVVCIERFRVEEATGTKAHDYAYFLASEKHNELTEATVLEALRAHWQIEKNHHRTREVKLSYDNLIP